MEKKYLMLLPLAVPLFFGGKAAVNALRRKTTVITKENGGSKTVLGPDSSADDVVENDMQADNLRRAVDIPEKKENVKPTTVDLVNMDAEVPEEIHPEEAEQPQGVKNNPTVLDDNLDEKTVFTGPKGGKYYLNEKGKKIYIK
jgi:hypothetical protein